MSFENGGRPMPTIATLVADAREQVLVDALHLRSGPRARSAVADLDRRTSSRRISVVNSLPDRLFSTTAWPRTSPTVPPYSLPGGGSA